VFDSDEDVETTDVSNIKGKRDRGEYEDGSDMGEDDESDVLDDDDDAEDEVVVKPKKSKQSKKNRDKEPRGKKKSRKMSYRNFILDQAEEADDDEQDDLEYEYVDRDRAVDDEALAAEELEANLAVERRHEANRKFQEQSAAEIAAMYEEKYRASGRYRPGYRGDGDFQGDMLREDVVKQSAYPGVNDPGIWLVKCRPGTERQLVRSILLKTMHNQAQGKPVLVKSAFCTASEGYIYIEAMEEPFVRETLTGLQNIFFSSVRKVPLAEMTTLLTVTVRRKPIKEGQWCRMKRGPLKGDLVKVVRVLEGGTRAFIQAVPRPDYDDTGKTSRTMDGGVEATKTKKTRPLQRLFLSEDAKAKGHIVDRRRHDGEFYEFWKNDLYKHGYLFKDVRVDIYLNTGDPNPRIHELTMFRDRKRDEGSDSDDGGEIASKSTSIMKELARQMTDEDGQRAAADKVVPFRAGDMVQVTGGEWRNMRGVIMSINERAEQAQLKPIHTDDLGEVTVETSLLVKYIRPGAHVKVINGIHMGQTGRVVSVHRADGDHIAAILTDGINTEITCNVGHLQVSNEVTTGLNSLGGYELYDLVMLSANEYAVVVFVGTEHLKVLTQHDIEKNVLPVEIKGKKSSSRGSTGAFDHMKNPLCVGDTVSVVEGQHSKLSGTIKHINRSILWLHSTTHLKNSGIFVVKGKSCLLAGGQLKDSASTTAAVLNATYGSNAPAVSRPMTFAKRGVKDPMVGKTVKLKKGSYKGLLAHIVDSTDTHYAVELHGRLKKLNIEKEKVVVVGDKEGAVNNDGTPMAVDNFSMVPSTPFLTAQTPMHVAETPMHVSGAETPLYGGSTPSRPDTPGRDGGEFDVWRPTSSDTMDVQDTFPASTAASSGWGGSDWRSPAGSEPGAESGAFTDSGWGDSGWGESGTGKTQGWGSSSAGGTHAWTSNAATANDLSNSLPPSEWERGMVVCFRSGRHTGATAVLESSMRQDDSFDVRLRDGRGTMLSSVSKHELSIAEPKKKDSVKIMKGTYAGSTGRVKAIRDSDVIVYMGGRTELVKLSEVVCVDDTSDY